MEVKISSRRDIPKEKIIALYEANEWSSAKKPDLLYSALMNSHSLVSAWLGDELIGLANAISDGFLVVYYPHMLVHPDYQGRGVGRQILSELQSKYEPFHMQMLTADTNAVEFYKKHGFRKAGETVPMWIYEGDEH